MRDDWILLSDVCTYQSYVLEGGWSYLPLPSRHPLLPGMMTKLTTSVCISGSVICISTSGAVIWTSTPGAPAGGSIWSSTPGVTAGVTRCCSTAGAPRVDRISGPPRVHRGCTATRSVTVGSEFSPILGRKLVFRSCSVAEPFWAVHGLALEVESLPFWVLKC